MSHHITTPVLACFYGSGNLMLLAIALADACPDASGKNIYKAVARLAHESRTSVRTAQTALRRLQADGWLIKSSAGNGGRGHATRYRIDEQWLGRARQEIADASIDNRAPALVPPPGLWNLRTLDESAVKGAEVAPFRPVDNLAERVQPAHERVQFLAVKGAEKRVKGEAAAAPEQRTEYLNTPLPPVGDGGLRDFQNLESEHPKSGPSDHRAAWRQWRRMRKAGRLTPQALVAMRKRLAVDKASPQWQAEGGRFIKNFSVWLAGWADGWQEREPAPPPQAAPPPPAPVPFTPAQLAANKARAVQAREALRRLRARDSLGGSERVLASMAAGAA